MLDITAIAMDPLDLDDEELNYELEIRNIRNVATKRAKTNALRNAFEREASGEERSPTGVPNVANVEINACERSYNKIIHIMNDESLGNLGKRACVSRLKHLLGRIKRIQFTSREEENSTIKFLNEIENVFRTIESAVTPPIEQAGATALPVFQQRASGINILEKTSIVSSIGRQQDLINVAHHSNENVSNNFSFMPPNQPNNAQTNNILLNNSENQVNNALPELNIMASISPGNPFRNIQPAANNFAPNFNENPLTNFHPITNNLPTQSINNNIPIRTPPFQRDLTDSLFECVRGEMQNSLRPTLSQRFSSMQVTFNVSAGSRRVHREEIPQVDQANRTDNVRQYFSNGAVNPPDRIDANRFRLDANNDRFDEHRRAQAQNLAGEYAPIFQNQEQFIRGERARRTVPVHQWRLQYSGDGRGLHLYDFLAQIELYRNSEQVSPHELLLSVVHLFSGRARMWFQAVHGTIRSWDELVAALKREFLPPNYDYILLSDISNRMQKNDESSAEYIVHMQSLFKFLAIDISADHKLFIVKNNLLNRYRIALAPINIIDLNHLSEVCRRMDEAFKRPSHLQLPFQNYSRSSFSFSNRENFQEVNAVDNNLVVDEDEENSREVAAVRQRINSRSQEVRNNARPNNPFARTAHQARNSIVCWNCDVEGHGFNTCPESQRGIFCFQCGNKGVIARNCACSGNGARNLENHQEGPNSSTQTPQ